MTDTEILDWLEEHPVVWRTYLHVQTPEQIRALWSIRAGMQVGHLGAGPDAGSLRDHVRMAVRHQNGALVCGNHLDAGRGHDEVAAQLLLWDTVRGYSQQTGMLPDHLRLSEPDEGMDL